MEFHPLQLAMLYRNNKNTRGNAKEMWKYQIRSESLLISRTDTTQSFDSNCFELFDFFTDFVKSPVKL